ncbi:MAG: ISL3 family transposase [Lachnospiraceae bacterium]|nr:ISL3 family transposase [Lachnospiraceae bacterium]
MKKNDLLANSLAGLPEDVSVKDFVCRDHSIELIVDWPIPGKWKRICPHCQNTHCTIKDRSTSQTIRHTPSGFRAVFLTYDKPRCFCPECRRSFYLYPEWAVPRISMSTSLLVRIYKLLTSTVHNITEIARETRTTPAVVQHVMDKLPADKPSCLPETLGIDEFHGDTGYYDKGIKRYRTEKYHCVIVDVDAHAVTDILLKPTYGVLKAYFMEYPPYKRRHVKYFCADMRSGFSRVARECFPKARICIDPFHVLKLLTEAVSEVRIEEWRALRDQWAAAMAEAKACTDPSIKEELVSRACDLENDYRLIKNSQRLLITSPYNDGCYWNIHEDEGQERKEKIFLLCPSLKAPYDALMEFYDITSLATPSEKVPALNGWINTYRDSDCPALRRSVHSIETHKRGIVNAWKYLKSNAHTESLNRDIKNVRRFAFGAHKFENFRKRVLLACGSVKFIDDPISIFKEKRSSKDSGKGGEADG